MNISAPFITRPVATALLAIAVLLGGLLGYRELPVSALPQVDFPTIQVTTQYPGASPDTVARLVTASLERQFGQITGLADMVSVSTEGVSQITLRFSLARNIDSAAQDVQSAINAAAGTLPTSLPYPPTYSKVNPADAPILTLALHATSVPMARIADATDTLLLPKLSQISGVGQVSIAGGLRRAVRVQVNPTRLAAYGLSLEDVRSAIAAANVNGAKGGFDGPQRAVTLGADDQITNAAGYLRMILAWRNGAPVRLRDVGTVVGGVENARTDSWFQGKPAVLLDIQRQPGANIVQTVAAVRAALPQLQATLPAGIDVAVVADRTDTIRASVTDVQITLLISVALVVGVIFFFLGSLRATLIPALALPLSLIGTFGVMALLGFGLDNLSLMALTVATGFVVDDAIVMIENVVRHIEAGMAPLASAYRGAGEIGFTIVSLTVSLIAVFIPLLFMGGVIGRLFSEFSITLSVAVLVSALISLTLTPMLCGRLLRPVADTHPGWLARSFARGEAALARLYMHSLDWTLRHERLMLVTALATLIGTVGLYLVVPKGFLPQEDTGIITATLEAGQSASVARMSRLQEQAVALVRADPAVADVSAFVGAGTVNATPNVARLTIALKPRNTRDPLSVVLPRLETRLGGIPGLSASLQPVQDITLGTQVTRGQYQYVLTDTDSTELNIWAPKLIAALSREPSLRHVTSDALNNGLMTMIEVDRNAAARLNVSMQAVEDTLYDAFGQRQVSTIFAQSNQYRVILEALPSLQQNSAILQRLYVPATANQTGTSATSGTSGGSGTAATSGSGIVTSATTQVPLSAIARFRRITAPLAITHSNQFPSVTISFDLAPGAALGNAVAAVHAASAQIGMPASINGRFTGDAAEFGTALAAEPWLILAAVVVIYIVLGVLYESFIHPVTILSTLPSAGIGALLALLVTGTDLSLVALVGIVLLMGIVKKNAIMMIDFALVAERSQGMSAETAIREACRLRFRPIMMTTMSALLGALPLVISQGSGSELRMPLGIAIVGGLLLSQFLTLYTTPAIYLGFERLRRRHRAAGTAASTRA